MLREEGVLLPCTCGMQFTGVKFCIPGFHLARGITAKIYAYLASISPKLSVILNFMVDIFGIA